MSPSLQSTALNLAASAYRRLPPRARSIAATARGAQLRRQRYGSDLENWVEEILDRDRWSGEQWQRWQGDRLAVVLERARTSVPAYREYWDREGGPWDRLERWPVLEKSELRRDSRRYLADDLTAWRLVHDHTSGTTGASLDLWLKHETVRAWYALAEARWRRWYGVRQGDRWGMIGGQLVVPVERRKPPFWVWNAALRQLYMSSYHLAPDLVDAYLDAIAARRLRYLVGYPSSLHALALGALRSGRTDVRLEVVIANAEPLYDHQRIAISEAFGCPVRETYGMAEAVAAASECEEGRLHLWPDAGIAEVEAPEGEPGELIATGLTNGDMPLIRYRVGDRVHRSAEECPCGRTLPVLAGVEGRSDDVLYTADGRRVGRLDPVFKDDSGIAEAQIVQREIDRLLVRYVPGPSTGPRAEAVLADRLRARMGDVRVDFDQVEAIERTSNGKFRAVVCELSPEQRSELEQG